MTPLITAFAASPDRGHGQARDMRVRWALEELGQPYDVQLVPFAQMKEPEHLARQPFGQIPTYQEGGLVLFESGAIVLHLALNHPGLLPVDDAGRARAMSWLFAALSTVEPPIVEREQAYFLERDRPWYAEHEAIMDASIRKRLRPLAASLGEDEWLDRTFTAGDLMMVMVLRRAEPHMLAEFPTLADYVARGEARPAFQRAYAAQRQVFLDASAPSASTSRGQTHSG